MIEYTTNLRAFVEKNDVELRRVHKMAHLEQLLPLLEAKDSAILEQYNLFISAHKDVLDAFVTMQQVDSFVFSSDVNRYLSPVVSQIINDILFKGEEGEFHSRSEFFDYLLCQLTSNLCVCIYAHKGLTI